LFCFCFCFLAYGVPGPGVRSELQLGPKLQLQQSQILNPLCWAGDQTWVSVLQRDCRSSCAIAGTRIFIKLLISLTSLIFNFFFVFLSFLLLLLLLLLFLGPLPRHMEVPRLGVESEPQPPAYARATATRDPSCVCNPHHSSRQLRIVNPLSKGRDRTRNPMVPSRTRQPLRRNGNSSSLIF